MFEETHGLALRLVREGAVDGLRVDHPDGLADPAGYLRRLRDGGAEHVWVEKILDPGEPLRDWPVEGTVGYEFLNDVAALFVDPAGEAPLTALWVELTGDDRPFGEVASEAKLEQARAVRARGRAAAARGAARGRRPRAHAGVAAGLPHLRRAGAGLSRTRPRGAPRGRAAGVAGARAAAGGARLGRVRHALPADHAARSWPRASRTPRSTATAGCWRSTTSAATRGASACRVEPSTPRTSSARSGSRATCSSPDARHEALGRRARADRRAGGDGRRVGRARPALARGAARR